MNLGQQNSALGKSTSQDTSLPSQLINHAESDKPLVSVVIPAYRVTGYIAETLDSVLAQTYKNFEIVVVNDGCPDTHALERAIDSYLERITYLKQPNRGASTARNTAVKNSSGCLIAFLDADDIWYPNYLAAQVLELESRFLDLVYCDALLFGDPIFDGKRNSEIAPSSGEVTFDSLLAYKCCPVLSGTMVRRSAFESVGGFSEELKRAMDYDLWLRMAYFGRKMGYHLKLLMKYRVRTDGISGNNLMRVDREIELFRRFQTIFDLNCKQQAEVSFRLMKLESDRDLELGKGLLLARRFSEAVGRFERANRFRRSLYLAFVVVCVKLLPYPFLLLFKIVRRKELKFIGLNEAHPEKLHIRR